MEIIEVLMIVCALTYLFAILFEDAMEDEVEKVYGRRKVK